MRDDLREVDGVEPAQHPALEHDRPAVLEHAHLAPVLVLDVGRRLLERDGLGLVDRAAAALHHQVRQREVVAEARVDLDVVLAPHRVDRAVAAGDRVQHRLGLAHAELVAPVRALAVRPRRPRRAAAGRRRTRRRVGEVADEPAQRRRRPRRVRVRRTRRSRRSSRARRGPARRPCRRAGSGEPDAAVALGDARDDVVGRVGRRVGGDDDLDLLLGVVEREQVLEPALDHVLLVVGGDDHGDRRQRAALAHRPRPDARRAPTRAG